MYMEYLPIYKLTIHFGESEGTDFQFPWSIWDLFLPTPSKVTCKVAVRQELMNLLAISAERQAWQGDDGVARFTGGMHC